MFRLPHLVSTRTAGRAPTVGFTLLELITVITLLALAIGEALPACRFLLDRMAVQGARETVVGIIHRARMEAVARGGSSIIIRSSPPSAELHSDRGQVASTEVGEKFGIILTLSRGRAEAEIRFDALGVGRVASQTITFTRGQARARLVVSSFGRVTRE